MFCNLSWRFLPFRKVLQAWHTSVLEERMIKEKAADEMYRYLLLKRCLGGWQKVRFDLFVHNYFGVIYKTNFRRKKIVSVT